MASWMISPAGFFPLAIASMIRFWARVLLRRKVARNSLALVKGAAQGGGEDEDLLPAVDAAVRVFFADQVEQCHLQLVARHFNGLEEDDGAGGGAEKADQLAFPDFLADDLGARSWAAFSGSL